MVSGATIVVVEDHEMTRRFLAENLAADGLQPLPCGTSAEARRMMATQYPDLAIVDLGLPDQDGLELVRDIRRADRLVDRLDPELPVIILSGRGSEIDRVRGLRVGADAYLVKPFAYPELHAHVEAVLRRVEHRPRRGRLRVGELEVDPLSRQVVVHGEPVSLSGKEFALLRALAAEPTRVFSRQELLRDVWGFRAQGATRTLDSHAARLRRKLSRGQSRFVINVWGVGYRLVEVGDGDG